MLEPQLKGATRLQQPTCHPQPHAIVLPPRRLRPAAALPLLLRMLRHVGWQRV